MGGGLPTDQPSDWPRLPEIGAYNLGIRQELDKILRDKSQDFARRWQYPRETILNVAIEHRLMHAETLAYMLHQLPVERKIAPPGYQSGLVFRSRRADRRDTDDRYSGGRRDAGNSARARSIWLGQ